MVAIAKEPVIVSDIACPLCGRGLPGAVVIPETTDRFGNTRRSYFGWCLACRRGIEAVQINFGGAWRIEKYRAYICRGGEGKPQAGAWVYAITLSAPIVLGPGGDFVVGYEPDVSVVAHELSLTIRAIWRAAKKSLQRRSHG